MDKLDFPKIIDSIDNFLTDEEGNISRNKLLRVGTLVILMSLIVTSEAFAFHESHSSHASHESHSSHVSHASSTHSSHSDHSSHSNHASHSNFIPSLSAVPNTLNPQSNPEAVTLPAAIIPAPLAVNASFGTMNNVHLENEAQNVKDIPGTPE